MHLNINDDNEIEDPTTDMLREAIAGLQAEEFVILAQEEEVYLQSMRDDDGSFFLEYRAGSEDEHYEADGGGLTLAQVQAIFVSYLGRNADWQRICKWVKVDIDPTEYIEDDEVDPFNCPETAHPRAQKLMSEQFFWDCVNEWAPFGSDEGHDAYYEWRRWRDENPTDSLVECFSWILDGNLSGYNATLYSDEVVERDQVAPHEAFLSKHFSVFTLDATILATALGQLIDEGEIDPGAKPYISVALSRQLHPAICLDNERRVILEAIQRVVAVA